MILMIANNVWSVKVCGKATENRNNEAKKTWNYSASRRTPQTTEEVEKHSKASAISLELVSNKKFYVRNRNRTYQKRLLKGICLLLSPKMIACRVPVWTLTSQLLQQDLSSKEVNIDAMYVSVHFFLNWFWHRSAH